MLWRAHLGIALSVISSDVVFLFRVLCMTKQYLSMFWPSKQVTSDWSTHVGPSSFTHHEDRHDHAIRLSALDNLRNFSIEPLSLVLAISCPNQLGYGAD